MPKTRSAVSGPSIHAIDSAINAIAFTPNPASEPITVDTKISYIRKSIKIIPITA